MTISRRRFLQFTAGAVGMPAAIVRADNYPSRPVTILVGFPQGGPVDIAARVIAPWLSARTGQPFEVVNRPGESGNIATRDALRAPADGYTLLLSGPVNTINTTLFPSLDFSFSRDSAPVAGISRVPLVIEVNPSLPIRSAAEFLAHAKANPGKLRIAYAGNGTPQHIGIELFKMMAGVDLTLVPYLGSTPALDDLLKGNVDAMFDPMPSSIKLIRDGKLRPLAVTGPARSPALPDVPTMSELVPGYAADSWFGIVAPAGTAADRIDRLSREVSAAFTDTAFASRLADLGATPMPLTPTGFAGFIASETGKYAKVIDAANIRVR